MNGAREKRGMRAAEVQEASAARTMMCPMTASFAMMDVLLMNLLLLKNVLCSNYEHSGDGPWDLWRAFAKNFAIFSAPFGPEACACASQCAPARPSRRACPCARPGRARIVQPRGTSHCAQELCSPMKTKYYAMQPKARS